MFAQWKVALLFVRFRDFRNPYPSKLIFVFEGYGPFHNNQLGTRGTPSWMMLFFSLLDFFLLALKFCHCSKRLFYYNYIWITLRDQSTNNVFFCFPFVGFAFVVIKPNRGEHVWFSLEWILENKLQNGSKNTSIINKHISIAKCGLAIFSLIWK